MTGKEGGVGRDKAGGLGKAAQCRVQSGISRCGSW